ncbi:MAG: hypothetical protein WAK03_10530 [Methylocystis sp.]|jgi:hypothetical protein
MNNAFAKITLAAGLIVGALTLSGGGASAMPALDRSVSDVAGATANVEQARWVCGPYRCWWRPNYYRPYGVYGYYGPRRYYGYRRWRRW